MYPIGLIEKQMTARFAVPIQIQAFSTIADGKGSFAVIARGCQEILQTGYRPESRNTTPHSRERGFGSQAGQKARERPPERLRPRIVPQGAAFPSLPA